MKVLLCLWLLCATALGAQSSPTDASLPFAAGDTPPAGGLTFPHTDGTQIALRVIDKQWAILQLDSEGKIIEPTERSAVVRATSVRDNDTRQNVFLTSNGVYLTSPRRVYPPYNHWVTVVLPREEGDAIVFPRSRFRQ